MINLSLYDISFMITEKFYNKGNITTEIKSNIINNVREALDNGKIANDIVREILERKGYCEDYIRVLGDIRSFGNLLKTGTFYFHNELRILGGKTIVDYDIETGEKKVITVESYSLEMKASYDVNDIVEYLRNKDCFENLLINIPKLAGGIKNLLSRYDIEFLLFLIDACEYQLIPRKIKAVNIFIVEDCIEEAKSAYMKKKTQSVISDEKIVPKERTLWNVI